MLTQLCWVFADPVTNIYNLLSQVYALVEFQPHMPLTLGITALHKAATTED